MQKLILIISLLAGAANAIYLEVSLQDSRIQNTNDIKNPGGMLGYNLNAGFFNEPENIVDFKTAFELKKFGYSHEFRGEETTTALWSVGMRPLILSVSYMNIAFETYGSCGYIFGAENITPYMRTKLFRKSKPTSYTFGYGYKLGYRFKKDFETGLIANYSIAEWRVHNYFSSSGTYNFGGLGLYFNWNVW